MGININEARNTHLYFKRANHRTTCLADHRAQCITNIQGEHVLCERNVLTPRALASGYG